MSKITNKIVIDIDQISQNKAIENLLPDSMEELTDLIGKRIDHARQKEKAGTHTKEYFEALREHDSILVDGTRGTGKTTVIRHLNEYLKSDSFTNKNFKKDNVKILQMIDPNYLDSGTNILSIMIRIIFESAKRESGRSERSKEFRRICELKDVIEETIFNSSQRKYENSSKNSKTIKEEMELDFTIHQFADEVCKYLGVDILILPIDDIDMALDHGSQIVETLRRYMQTPKIIPIIALDSAQIYALIKKEYFAKFGYEASQSLSDIDVSTELNFLQKLPSEYIQKILPPMQRVILPDMLGHYKSHLNAKKNKKNKHEIYFKYSSYSNELNKEWKIEWSFDQLLKILMNVFFDYDGKNILDYDDYHIVNYLKNKTFRSFLDDVKALMKSMVLKKYSPLVFTINTQCIKDRFRLYSRETASNKYDAALWFWDNFIEKFYNDLKNNREKKDIYSENISTMNIVESLLTITPHDAKDLGRKEKIYYRLFLQDFFIKNINIAIDKEIIIEKDIDFSGYHELVLRTFFPAKLLEHMYNYGFISIDSFPLERLRQFSNTDVHSQLYELYDTFLPLWTLDYKSSKKHYQTCRLKKVASNNRNNILHYTTNVNFELGRQSYHMHSYKFFAFISEIGRYSKQNIEFIQESIYNYMPKGLKGKRGSLDSLDEYGTSVSNIAYKIQNVKSNFNSFQFKTSNIGIISSLESVDFLIKNLSLINSNLISFDNFFKKMSRFSLTLEEIHFLYQQELNKYLALTDSVFLNAFIVFIIKNGNINILNFELLNEDYIIKGTEYNDDFLFQIEVNPFLHNFQLLLEQGNEILPIIRFIYLYIELSNIEKLYTFNNKSVDRINKLLKKSYLMKDSYVKKKIQEDVLSHKYIYKKIFKLYYTDTFNEKSIQESQKNIEKDKSYDDKYKIIKDVMINMNINEIEDKIEKNIKKLMIYTCIYYFKEFSNLMSKDTK